VRRWRRRGLPEDVRTALRLERGEHVLAHATDTAGRSVVATDLGLHLQTPTGGFRRLGWEAIDQVSWDQDAATLHVREADGGAAQAIPMREPGMLPETVRERVNSTIVISEHVRLAGNRGVRLVARRSPRGGAVRWEMLFDRGIDPEDPSTRALAESALDHLRRQTGV
jgi:hypothetical protein